MMRAKMMANGGAMKKKSYAAGGAPKAKMALGGGVKAKMGTSGGSASKRADGIAQRGKTKTKMV
jgi:hypothetical protein